MTSSIDWNAFGKAVENAAQEIVKIRRMFGGSTALPEDESIDMKGAPDNVSPIREQSIFQFGEAFVPEMPEIFVGGRFITADQANAIKWALDIIVRCVVMPTELPEEVTILHDMIREWTTEEPLS